MERAADSLAQTFSVEVAYARPEQQLIVQVEVQAGATVRDAIERSKILERFKDIQLDSQKVGIFGRLATLDSPLLPRDRVEIYRPLIADPKEVRKQRAKEGVKVAGSSDNLDGG